MKNISLVLYVLAFGMLINACNDPSPIGSELLQEDQVDVFFSDTITMTASTIKEDSILTYDPNPSVIFDNFLFGDFNDPIYGKTVAEIYAQLVPDFDVPDYEDAILDSIVLILEYDTSSTYGIIDQDPFGIGVYQIMDDIDKESKYYSNSSFNSDLSNPLVEVSNFTPMIFPQDSILGLIDYTFDADGDTIGIPASLRINLMDAVGEQFMALDSITHSSNTNFVAAFNGLHIKPLTETPGMLSFDITSSSVSGISVYYRQEDTIKQQYNYQFSSSFIQFNSYDTDFSGTDIETAFDDTVLGDSILFLQAMSGPNVKVEFPNTSQFDNVIINKVELEFTVADLANDDLENYSPSRSLIAADIGDEGQYVFINDVVSGGVSFGGFLRDNSGPQNEDIQTYQMNISGHFQDIVDGISDNAIYLRVFPKQEQSSRSIIYGPGHSVYPMKLRVTYTKLN